MYLSEGSLLLKMPQRHCQPTDNKYTWKWIELRPSEESFHIKLSVNWRYCEEVLNSLDSILKVRLVKSKVEVSKIFLHGLTPCYISCPSEKTHVNPIPSLWEAVCCCFNLAGGLLQNIPCSYCCVLKDHSRNTCQSCSSVEWVMWNWVGFSSGHRVPLGLREDWCSNNT